jgi:hypothetical protein
LLFAPVSGEEMRAASVLSMVAMAVLVGRRFFGRYGRAAMVGVTVVYIGGIVAVLVYHVFGG